MIDLKEAQSLLDASVLMTASHTYYPLDRVPEFWEWLKNQGEQGRVKIPFEIFAEIKDGPDDQDLLFHWISEKENQDALLLDEEVNVELVRAVLLNGYAPDLNDTETIDIGRDPFLIAYALADRGNRCVVTVETSKPSATRAKRKIPDVCKSLGVKCYDPFQLYRLLDFKTRWK